MRPTSASSASTTEPCGWQVYRAGAMVGALIRAVVLPGERGRKAANRFHLYRRGPCRVEDRT